MTIADSTALDAGELMLVALGEAFAQGAVMSYVHCRSCGNDTSFYIYREGYMIPVLAVRGAEPTEVTVGYCTDCTPRSTLRKI